MPAPWIPLLLAGAEIAVSRVAREQVGRADRTAWVPILMYHHVNGLRSDADEEARRWTVDIPAFAAQMRWLSDHGWQTISCALLVDHLEHGTPLPATSVILTFDDGWVCGHDTVLPILQQHGYRGTFFVCAGGVDVKPSNGRMSWAQIRRMVASGMEIASHSLSHRRLPELSVRDQRRELVESRAIIERQLGHTATAFAYPYGQYDDRVVGLVKAAGYACALGIEPGCVHRSSDLFRLRRNRVSYGDTLETFEGLVTRP